jgi:hypothetical protein
MEDVNLKTVQELMEHKTIAMTARYAHLAPGYLASGLETFVQRKSREEKKAKGGKEATGTWWSRIGPRCFFGPVMLLAYC